MAENPFFNSDLLSADYLSELVNWSPRPPRILILVDGEIRVTRSNGVRGASREFGISRVIEELRLYSTRVDCNRVAGFDIHVATRNGKATQPLRGFDHTEFRFSPVGLELYDQVWLFGFNPGNVAENSRNPDDDAKIMHPSALPLSKYELDALARWMDKGGSVFAAGDHHFLGASMCSRG